MSGAESKPEGKVVSPRASRPTWILILLMVALAIGIVNIAVFIYGFTLPDTWSVQEAVLIEADPQAVFPNINDPRHWSRWSVWSESEDPTLHLEYLGEASGAGAAFEWSGEALGSGKLSITDSEPSQFVAYELELQGEEFSENGKIVLERLPKGTRVVWTDGGDLSGTLGRLFRTRLESAVATDFAKSLQKLKRLVEEENVLATD